MPAKPTAKKTTAKSKYIHSVGRRKRAIARVRLYPKQTKKDELDIIVNNKPISDYFHNPVSKLNFADPLRITNTLSSYRVTAKITGSGLRSQLDALLHGISRALIKADENFRPVLKKRGLLTRDPRKRQRRMVGTGGKSRRKKQSPKR